ncbi:MAG: right-handed parallel beta-helix repeat-containing protein, partial [Candidatus Thermoplasmatota archaeon]|nr:right-handed parallel beta-helix repeat-containing protein [Candidatus Thermoplasmatota archaeon]
MPSNLKMKSISMITLMFLSVMLSVISVPVASAAGINETTGGLVNGQETWTGTHTLTDSVTVSPGASLIVNAGTTINIPYGKHIDVEGAICVASVACGAPADGSASSKVSFVWTLPTESEYLSRGSCQASVDAACGSGVIIRNTIDEAKTGFNFVEFENAFGYEYLYSASGNTNVKYAALVFDGPQTTANGLEFINVNSSNIFLTNLANPTITGSTFTLGVDGYTLPPQYTYAVDAINAGSGISAPMRISSSSFTGDAGATCGQNPSGINMINIENSYVSLDDITITDNGFGVFLKQSSGEIINSNIDINCAAVNTNGFKQTGSIKHTLEIKNNTLTTAEGAGITAFDQARVYAYNNTISGAESGSGIAVRSSIADLYNNTIGPIGGYNGLWIYGSSDVRAINNTITDTAAEAVVHGEYHYLDDNWPREQPTESRLYFKKNVINNNAGMCNSENTYGDEDFQCPAIHIFRASATIYNNVVSNNLGDALRIKGG